MAALSRPGDRGNLSRLGDRARSLPPGRDGSSLPIRRHIQSLLTGRPSRSLPTGIHNKCLPTGRQYKSVPPITKQVSLAYESEQPLPVGRQCKCPLVPPLNRVSPGRESFFCANLITTLILVTVPNTQFCSLIGVPNVPNSTLLPHTRNGVSFTPVIFHQKLFH